MTPTPRKPKTKTKPLKKHDLICAAATFGTYVEVAKAFNCSPQNVRSHVLRERQLNSDNPPRRAGAVEKFNDHDKRRIKAVIRKNPYAIDKEMLVLLEESGFEMCAQTLRRLRREMGFVRVPVA